MRLIDADKLKQHYSWWNNEEQRMLDQIVDSQPTVETVVRGKWIPVTNGRGGSECNMCHAYAPSYQSGAEYNSPYCPECGAKMDGGDHDAPD